MKLLTANDAETKSKRPTFGLAPESLIMPIRKDEKRAIPQEFKESPR
jgi:hypothetical protein